jgi:hypothetical protein
VILSNAWAGNLISKYEMPNSRLFAAGSDFNFMISDGVNLKCIKDSKSLWSGKITDHVIGIKYCDETNSFWILGSRSLTSFSLKNKKLVTIFEGTNFTSFDLIDKGSKTILGTKKGYFEINNVTRNQIGNIHQNLPCNEITSVAEINGNLWFGSAAGAFMQRDDGKYNYYNGERWLTGDQVVQVTEGPDHTVLVLGNGGLAQICFKKMTLEDKAMYFEKQVRERHIRYGLNASLVGMNHGNLSKGYLKDSDNDGLWTAMYLGAEIFRYAATKSDEALQNCSESLDAIEKLYSVSAIPGFPARSFERSGNMEKLSDSVRWQHSQDPGWDWKSTTSSDEAIGHIFALGAMAELIGVEPLKSRAIHLIDNLMQYILDHDLYMVDYDKKPTTLGKWDPETINSHPTIAGDRKITSSNIIAMLQTAYQFTHKENYKEKALELMEKNGYLDNLMHPMGDIGIAPATSSELSKNGSDTWNHSDDQLYFLGYWGLYRYAFNNDLKAKYKEAIIDHWKIERPEKDGAWNIFTSLVSDNFDLNEAVWYLQQHPLDMINWDISNSHRKDIEFIAPNFRNQTLKEVLPPDERPIQRHNSNMFTLDKKGDNGTTEQSAGDIWLLPYWMGRYLGVISAPKK